MKRILIVNVNWLGDALFTTPFISAIDKVYPSSYIATLVVPRCKEILENNPAIDEIIMYDERGMNRGIFGKMSLVSELKKRQFDTAFILRRSLTRTMLLMLAGIPNRIGYGNPKTGMLLTKRIKPIKGALHKVEHFLNIARQIGITSDVSDYTLVVSQEDERFIEQFLKKEVVSPGDLLIAINPGANWKPKRWQYENFAKLAKALDKNYSARIVITGSESDIELAKDIASLSGIKPIIACGKTTIKQLAALFRKVKLVITNDSGPMHIAASQQTPLITLFGPTSPYITGPYGTGRSIVIRKDIGCDVPCYNLNCQKNHCMKSITVDDVLEAVDKLL